MRVRWKWSVAPAAPIALAFLAVDSVFFVANLLKIFQGGIVPLLIGAVLFTVMITWHRGIELVREGLRPFGERSGEVLRRLRSGELLRPTGSVVFLSHSESEVPPAMARYIEQFRSLPEKVVVLSVAFEEQARISPDERVGVRAVLKNIWLVSVRFGFVEIPSLSSAMIAAKDKGCGVDLDRALHRQQGRDRPERGPASSIFQNVGVASHAVRLHVPQRRPRLGPLRPTARRSRRDRQASRGLIGCRPETLPDTVVFRAPCLCRPYTPRKFDGTRGLLPPLFVQNAAWGDILAASLVPIVLILPESGSNVTRSELTRVAAAARCVGV